jgi:hypothetical protein
MDEFHGEALINAISSSLPMPVFSRGDTGVLVDMRGVATPGVSIPRGVFFGVSAAVTTVSLLLALLLALSITAFLSAIAPLDGALVERQLSRNGEV